MLLTIDVGNTNITFALFKDKDRIDKKIAFRWTLQTRLVVDGVQIEKNINERLSDFLKTQMPAESLGDAKISEICIGSVVPRITEFLSQLKVSFKNVKFVISGEPNVVWNLKANAGNINEVGADILLNGMAGYDIYKSAILIVDFGTATTFDLFNDEGNFLGTAISSGVNLSAEALFKSCALLERVSVLPTDKIICTNTKDCMQSGLFWGYLSMVEGMVKRIKVECKINPTVIATGGLAPLFKEHTQMFDCLDEDLTLKGLCMLANIN